jgi:hypothetical protein
MSSPHDRTKAAAAVPLDTLLPKDVQHNWLWQYVPSRDGRLWVKPVELAKARQFAARLAGTTVELADGSRHVAFIDGLALDTPEFCKHFRELVIWVDGFGWFRLARYNDSEEIRREQGDEVLARLFKRPLKKVFPIKFDLRDRSSVDSPCLTGAFEHNPAWGLSRPDVMGMLVREHAAAAGATRKKRKR